MTNDLNKEARMLERKAEKIAINPKRAVLTKSEQLDVFARARLALVLRAPKDVYDQKEFELLRKQQAQRIRDFADLLEQTAVSEFGSLLIAVYPCEF